jgi:hypothetical protein
MGFEFTSLCIYISFSNYEPYVSFDVSRSVVWQERPDVAEESSTVVESEFPTE